MNRQKKKKKKILKLSRRKFQADLEYYYNMCNNLQQDMSCHSCCGDINVHQSDSNFTVYQICDSERITLRLGLTQMGLELTHLCLY